MRFLTILAQLEFDGGARASRRNVRGMPRGHGMPRGQRLMSRTSLPGHTFTTRRIDCAQRAQGHVAWSQSEIFFLGAREDAAHQDLSHSLPSLPSLSLGASCTSIPHDGSVFVCWLICIVCNYQIHGVSDSYIQIDEKKHEWIKFCCRNVSANVHWCILMLCAMCKNGVCRHHGCQCVNTH